jgi:hypothetical protein
MKITDITNENLTEGPVNRAALHLRKGTSKFLNRIGAKNTANRMAGKADSDTNANTLYNKFNAFLGQQSKHPKNATGEDLKNFLKRVGHKSGVAIPDGPIDKKTMYKAFRQFGGEKVSGVMQKPAPAPTKGKQPPPVPSTTKEVPVSNYTQAKKLAASLNAKEKRRLADQLLKSIKTRK